jgi:hypothetical protein
MGLESVEMKAKHNISPGRPGQGTANMMMPNVGPPCRSHLDAFTFHAVTKNANSRPVRFRVRHRPVRR